MHKLTLSWIISYVRCVVLTKVKIIYIKYRNFSRKKKIWIFLGGRKNQKNQLVFLRKKPLGLNRANPDKKYEVFF